MSKFVVRLDVNGEKREYIRPAYCPHKLKRQIEDNYPASVKVLEIYKL